MNWKQKLGHYSTIALGAAAALPAVWATNPDLHVLVPADKLSVVTGIIAAAGLVGKFLPQGGPVVSLPKEEGSKDIADALKAAVKEKGAEYVAKAIGRALK